MSPFRQYDNFFIVEIVATVHRLEILDIQPFWRCVPAFPDRTDLPGEVFLGERASKAVTAGIELSSINEIDNTRPISDVAPSDI